MQPAGDACPHILDRIPVPLYAPEFAADPHTFYTAMREKFGSLAPVELSPGITASLVIGYRTAVAINNDPERFPADPRAWEQDIPADCPILPMLQYRPNALRSAGSEHARYRRASVDSIDAINLYQVDGLIEEIVVPQVNTFCVDGEADLISQYAFPVTFAYLNAMVGCPADIGQQVARGMAMMFEGDQAEAGNALFVAALGELVALKKREPGEDVTTRLLVHAAELTDEELVHQLVTIYGAGIEPLTNLIANTLLLMLTDERFSGAAALTTRDALNELLFTDPPLANFGITYPAQPILVETTWLPANQPVVTSMAACNNDPEIVGRHFTGNNAHLAWGTGPHACPAQDVAYSVAQHAIDQLFDRLPELRLGRPADQLEWRPGPFHRSLASLPVVFPPVRRPF
ncbi:cytochrome P450 [Nocardia yunnanensis]|uniref:Cytochrome P450 n=1 Tax=Nocardia yunnanensis TaxID=2382165 RepID=A0A386ZIR9_9NOCA|nr:cytochrome P450 [Nocardia yunnanensis]AYF77411.1 cytochrome P450 [Nocardia yunnanensis]